MSFEFICIQQKLILVDTVCLGCLITQFNVATLVGKPWAVDMVDEGVSRSFKPWDLESTEYPPTAASKRVPRLVPF
jgi:hypothetical protein